MPVFRRPRRPEESLKSRMSNIPLTAYLESWRTSAPSSKANRCWFTLGPDEARAPLLSGENSARNHFAARGGPARLHRTAPSLLIAPHTAIDPALAARGGPLSPPRNAVKVLVERLPEFRSQRRSSAHLRA